MKVLSLLLAFVASEVINENALWSQILPLPGRLTKRDLPSRIIGGSAANPDDYKYIAHIIRASDGSHVCTAELITSNVILTTAHCMNAVSTDKKNWDVIQVSLGSIQALPNNDNTVYNIKSVEIHPEYENIPPYANDIALIFLDRCVSTDVATPVEIDTDPIDKNKTYIAAGFGYTSSSSNTSSALNTLNVIQGRQDYCNRFLASENVQGKVFCAGVTKGKTVCSGDSGSPLTGTDHLKLNGIASTLVSLTGKACETKDTIAVYMLTAYYWDNFISKYVDCTGPNCKVSECENAEESEEDTSTESHTDLESLRTDVTTSSTLATSLSSTTTATTPITTTSTLSENSNKTKSDDPILTMTLIFDSDDKADVQKTTDIHNASSVSTPDITSIEDSLSSNTSVQEENTFTDFTEAPGCTKSIDSVAFGSAAGQTTEDVFNWDKAINLSCSSQQYEILFNIVDTTSDIYFSISTTKSSSTQGEFIQGIIGFNSGKWLISSSKNSVAVDVNLIPEISESVVVRADSSGISLWMSTGDIPLIKLSSNNYDSAALSNSPTLWFAFGAQYDSAGVSNITYTCMNTASCEFSATFQESESTYYSSLNYINTPPTAEPCESLSVGPNTLLSAVDKKKDYDFSRALTIPCNQTDFEFSANVIAESDLYVTLMDASGFRGPLGNIELQFGLSSDTNAIKRGKYAQVKRSDVPALVSSKNIKIVFKDYKLQMLIDNNNTVTRDMKKFMDDTGFEIKSMAFAPLTGVAALYAPTFSCPGASTCSNQDSIPTGRWFKEVVSDLNRSKICILVRHILSRNCAVTSSTKDGASVSLLLTERVTILFDSPPRSRPTKKFRHPSLLPLSSLPTVDISGIRSRVLYLTTVQYLQSSNMWSMVSALFFLQNGHLVLNFSSIVPSFASLSAVQNLPVLILPISISPCLCSGYVSCK
ncbi:Serine protease easter [Zancudomyces culisetae]|uniref:Serine protease easter n=1 Tax=Zancudomyces culisetae TaxID=1213189 RepID=A0A1R1PS02_ZANCU|nr:Serine protease easter [Zancudomyces culisetae]|eukprot:OMH83672.1 Serine protease easter [Zancudomyces culisetae]